MTPFISLSNYIKKIIVKFSLNIFLTEKRIKSKHLILWLCPNRVFTIIWWNTSNAILNDLRPNCTIFERSNKCHSNASFEIMKLRWNSNFIVLSKWGLWFIFFPYKDNELELTFCRHSFVYFRNISNNVTYSLRFFWLL